MRNRQAEIIKHLTSKQLMQQVIISQFILLFLGIFLSFFLFDSFYDWALLFRFDIIELMLYGLAPGLLVVFIDLLIIRYLPAHLFDDGGINKKLFQHATVTEAFIICLVVAISEEVLFRGLVQTEFGFVFASILFAIVHVRYLTKPILLLSVLFLSFYIGYLYEITQNLVVTIATHFTIDFLLALIIRYRK